MAASTPPRTAGVAFVAAPITPEPVVVPLTVIAQPLVTHGVTGAGRWVRVRRTDHRYQTTYPY